MALKALDESHKQLAEFTLRGVPLTQIAKTLEVERSTCYRWMRDPLWLAYFAQLSKEVSAARIQRMTPVVMAGAEAMESAFRNAIADLNSDDPVRRASAPSMKMIGETLKIIASLECDDQRQPIPSDPRPPADDVDNPGSQRLLKALDDMVTTSTERALDERVVDVE